MLSNHSYGNGGDHPHVQNPKKIPVHPRPSDPIPNPPPPSENVHSLPVNSSTTPPSSGCGGDPKAAAAAHSVSSDATGAVIGIQKKIRRAERFGMPEQLSEEEKRNSRAERFGTVIGSHGSRVLKKSEESMRKARAERFGLVQSTSADEEAKKKASLARFAPASKHDSVEEDKRKARVIRFSQNQSISLTQANFDEKIATKAAVLGKEGGAP